MYYGTVKQNTLLAKARKLGGSTYILDERVGVIYLIVWFRHERQAKAFDNYALDRGYLCDIAKKTLPSFMKKSMKRHWNKSFTVKVCLRDKRR